MGATLGANLNGDLTFVLRDKHPRLTVITCWDYKSSTEVQKYKWLNENTIEIETKDTTMIIVVPRFNVIVKK